MLRLCLAYGARFCTWHSPRYPELNSFIPRPTEVNRFDAINLLVDVLLADQVADGQIWARGGRQELIYGSQRLVSSRPWRNTTVTFDGAKLFWKGVDARLDAFWVRPIDIRQHIPRDSNFDHPDQSQQFFGAFASWNPSTTRTLEAFYLGYIETDPLIVSGLLIEGDFETHTFGGRIHDTTGTLRYEIEGGYQFGSFTSLSHSAGFVTAGAGKQVSRGDWKASLWLYYDWASGDRDPTDTRHGTFLQQFPRGHYYLGIADIVGRQNVQDLNLQWSLNYVDRIKFVLAYHVLLLSNRRDALYNPAGIAIYHDPTGASGREVGQEIDAILNWSITPRTHLGLGYSHVFAGSYFDRPVIRGGPAGRALNGANGRDADFFYSQFTLRF